MIFSLFKKVKKPNKIFYSCVVDDNPKFYWQGYIFVNSLINCAKISGDRIFVHLTKSNIQFENFLKANSVNIKFIEPWGDNKYCNKLQQLETKELQKADFVWLCDADIAISEDLVEVVDQDHNRVLGKIVDFPNPDIDKLKQIYDYFKVDYPLVSIDTLVAEETFEGNFNGGLYGIPSKYIAKFSKSWKKYANQMLSAKKITSILDDKINHIDQISFSLALKELNLPYKTLGYEYNCPTHIEDISLLDSKLESNVKVVHYHNNISQVGLLNILEHKYVKSTITVINNVIKHNFNNSLFWSYRYATNPELGSGLGSRGSVADYKLRLLKNIGIENDKSVIDVGCGDLEIVKNLSFNKYTGVDISAEAVANGKKKFPRFEFYNFDLNKDSIGYADTVVCLDVLIHQPSKESYDELIDFVIAKAKERVIISGYEMPVDSSHMCFYYESLKDSLEKTGLFKYIYKVGEYRGLGMYVADKGKLLATGKPNDINNSIVEDSLKLDCINSDLLLEVVTVSRANFGWYTKHYPRVYEYQWVLDKLGRDLSAFNIADFGAGVTPLPLLLAQRGAKVYTIDKHEKRIDLEHVCDASEWGFFDYSTLDNTICSYNQALEDNTFAEASLDVWYSVSVVEHMPAKIRRNIFNIMANSLKPNGQLLLTIDLEKNSDKLWNMSEGEIVEDAAEHGTLDTLILELDSLGFDMIEKEVYHMPKGERVDIAMIRGVLKERVK